MRADVDTCSVEATLWDRAGYTPAATQTRLAAGIPEPSNADAWRARGFSPATAAPWIALDLLPAEAATIADAALTPDYVRRVRAADRHYCDVTHQRAAAITSIADAGI